jgi:tetratricopeptide (TPR) repeat protein
MIGRRDPFFALLEQAQRYARTRQYGRASVLAARVIRRRPDDPRGYRVAGDAELGRRNFHAACVRLEQALRLTPDDAGLHRLLAGALRCRRVSPPPERRSAPVADTAGLDPDAWCQLALIAYDQGDAATTRRWADRALALDHRHAAAVSVRAISEIFGRTPGRDAVPMYLRALAVDPGNPRVHHDLGTLYLSLGDHERAEHHLRRALAGRPDEAAFRTSLYAVLRHRSAIYRVLTWPLQRVAAWPRYASMVAALAAIAALAALAARQLPATPTADALGALQASALILATCFMCAWWPLVMIYEWLVVAHLRARRRPPRRSFGARFALYVVFMACVALVIVLAAVDPLTQRFLTVFVVTLYVSIGIGLGITAVWSARRARAA